MTSENAPELSKDNYKNYSLEQLKVWVQDALSSEASATEIADVIVETLEEEMAYHRMLGDHAADVLRRLKGDKIAVLPNSSHPEVTRADWNDFWDGFRNE